MNYSRKRLTQITMERKGFFTMTGQNMETCILMNKTNQFKQNGSLDHNYNIKTTSTRFLEITLIV